MAKAKKSMTLIIMAHFKIVLKVICLLFFYINNLILTRRLGRPRAVTLIAAIPVPAVESEEEKHGNSLDELRVEKYILR
jgi:hypothetical protein